MIKVIPHGQLAALYPSLSIGASTPAEAIEGWSRQVGMGSIPLDKRIVMDVVGFEDVAKLADPTDLTEIHLMPSMFGGGSFGKIILGAAIIAAAFLPFIPPFLKTYMIATGISIALGGVIELFNKAPTTNKSADPAASKYLGNSSNTTAIGTLIAFGGGRMRAGGQYLSVAVDSSDISYGTFPATVPT
jgi:predicted phage tail protein